MRLFYVIAAVVAGLAAPAHAFSADTGRFEAYEFVAETDLTNAAGEAQSLCYVTKDLRILGLTLVSDIQSYGLSTAGCADPGITAFSPAQMQAAQSAGLIDPQLPTVARNDMMRHLQNYGLWAAIALALVAVIIRRMKSLLGFDPDGPLRPKASSRVLTAMCHMGAAGGVMNPDDVQLVAHTARRITRRNYQTSDALRVADMLPASLSPADYAAFGSGLRDHEKDAMLQAVLYIGMARGKIQRGQYQFATKLAGSLGMPGADFRRVLDLAFADLDKYPPQL